MAVAADDDVIVDRDTKRAGGIDDLLGHIDIGARRRRIARGMIVRQYTRRPVSVIFQHITDTLKSTRVVNWYMWCVTGRDE